MTRSIEKVFAEGDLEFAKYIAGCLKGKVAYSNKTLYLFNDEFNHWVRHDDFDKLTVLVGEVINEKYKALKKTYAKDERLKQLKGAIEKQHQKAAKYSFMEKIAKLAKVCINDDSFAVKLDNERHTINFKNGTLDLKTGKFAERGKDNYVSTIIDWEYKKKPDSKKVANLRKIIEQVCNDNKNDFNDVMLWLAYCITGEVKECKFMTFTGYSASNGKSTLINMMIQCFPQLVRLGQSEAFEKNFSNKHKFLINYTKPVRAVIMNEYESEKLDTKTIKNWCDGTTAEINVLYSKATKFEIMSKLLIVGNNDLRFMNDQGMARRGYKVEFTNVFKDKKDIKEGEKNVYAKKDLRALFDDDEYKNAFIHILLEHTKIYYASGFDTMSMKVVEEYQDICDNNDPMAEFFENYVVKKEGSRVGKKAFEKRYNEINNTKLPFTFLLSSIKRLGYTYDKALRCGGLRGAIVDIALKKFSDHDNDSEGEDFVDALEGRPKKKTVHDIFEKCVLDQEQEEPKEEEKVVEKKKKVKKANVVKGEKESFKICFD